MKKISLIKNPELFQGKKYLEKSKNYFEGWYFKNTNNKTSISFIPGISITKEQKHAFIQIITTDSSYYVYYDINEFKYNNNPFYIQIGNNIFSKKGIYIDINDEIQKLKIYGDITYSDIENINTNILNPNIMGPFSYLPFMECNHAVLSMKCSSHGLIKVNNKKIRFKNDTSYIEKDWGYSFPKYYIWYQGNNFKNNNASFMLSIADIPLKVFHFKGIICSLIIEGHEYRFATYNNTKIIKYNVTNNIINITLKKGKYYLNIKSIYDKGSKLSAPINGKMIKDVYESINSTITVTLKKNNEIIFSDTSTKCGLEISY